MFALRLMGLVVGVALAAACTPKEPALKGDPASWRLPPAGSVVGGKVAYGAHAWLGIPFAEPPTGPLRWRAPQPLKPWMETRAAYASGPACPQYSSPLGGVEGKTGEIVGSEDCLTLDIYAPAFTKESVPTGASRLPVMVWIHGGGNAIGTARNYQGGNLAVSQNVIVVNVQYRMGPLGWFRHAALRKETNDPAEQSGNFGTLDQIQALKWVQENISAFGGDPGNVTIFGESAGGRNVFVLLMSPLAKGLFHRAISQSGAAVCDSLESAELLVQNGGHPKSSGETLLALAANDTAGAPPLDRDAAAARVGEWNPETVREYLRDLTPEELLGAFKPTDQRLILYPNVFGDGHVVPERCGDVFATGEWNKVPAMIGANRDEAKLFMFANEKYVKRLFGLVPRYQVTEPTYQVLAAYGSRIWRHMSVDVPAAKMATTSTDVYAYRFDWDELPTIYGVDLAAMLGAAHGFEIPFVFGHFDLGREAEMLFPEETLASRKALADGMMAYWGSFARTGKPGEGRELEKWAPYGEKGVKLVFDTPEGGGIRAEIENETVAKLVEEIAAEGRLQPSDRCELLMTITYRSTEFTRADYEKRDDCKIVPYRVRTEL